jgi:hypothetical protein
MRYQHFLWEEGEFTQAIIRSSLIGTFGISLPLGQWVEIRQQQVHRQCCCRNLVWTSLSQHPHSYSSEPHWQFQILQQVLHHQQAMALCPYHGNDCPWLPTLHHADRLEACMFSGYSWLLKLWLLLVVTYYDGTDISTAIRPFCVYALWTPSGALWGVDESWSRLHILAHRGSETSPLVYHLQTLHRDTEVKSMPLKPWHRTMDIVKIPACEMGISKSYRA